MVDVRVLTREEVLARVVKVTVEQLGITEKAGPVEEGNNFVEDLNADSLDLTELIMALEEEFKPYGMGDISNEDAEKIATVGMAVDYVFEHMQAA